MRDGSPKAPNTHDTIVALATPQGRSAIGTIRASGPMAVEMVREYLHVREGLSPRRATLGRWVRRDGTTLDEVVATWFKGPSSYTGEDVIEISAHGSPRILRTMLEDWVAAGARLARPGEFTIRAVAAGKMDLVQAEAVRDFVDAETAEQSRIARLQMGGSLSRALGSTKDGLIDVVARLEAEIDFAEDDVETSPNDIIADRIAAIATMVRELLGSYEYGKAVRDATGLAIVGRPNVGKSSLFNVLVGFDRAIVTPIAGTTRDIVTETVEICGLPVRCTDTAGVRETTDEVEQIGVRRTHEAIADADLVVAVFDSSEAESSEDGQLIDRLRDLKPIWVLSKSDLERKFDVRDFLPEAPLLVSSANGSGVEALRDAIQSRLHATAPGHSAIVTNVRHATGLKQCLDALEHASHAARGRVPHEMVLVDLYQALAAIGALTGEVVTDDILDRIFTTFCIGK